MVVACSFYLRVKFHSPVLVEYVTIIYFYHFIMIESMMAQNSLAAILIRVRSWLGDTAKCSSVNKPNTNQFILNFFKSSGWLISSETGQKEWIFMCSLTAFRFGSTSKILSFHLWAHTHKKKKTFVYMIDIHVIIVWDKPKP